eukprot:111348-Prorocentrum_lima.AAC.1
MRKAIRLSVNPDMIQACKEKTPTDSCLMGLVRTPENVDRVTAKDVQQAAPLLKQLLLQRPGIPRPVSCIAMGVKDLD